MQSLEKEVFQRWQQDPGFRRQALRDAIQWQMRLLPAYPGIGDQPVAICALGYRWFDTPVEAMADAIHRAGYVEPDLDCTLEGLEWDIRHGLGGLWCVPGRPWAKALVVVEFITRTRQKHLRSRVSHS
ncbi:hypothetical protein [Stenotrophomonas sp.]|uniref:hypothetical protein n=1 Tax=Stenotrophomonas sp. TaxID=69392 RepID=UPI0028A96530|nr:hypothetical protein [Stenotrophomonas sp.]